MRGDEGEIRLDGQPVEIDAPGEARALGIGTVYQEVNLIPTMSVTKNLTLGRQPRRFGLISWREARGRARERLKRLNIDIDVERPLGSYSVAIQQLVAIARALEDDTRVLVLDEPTASLDANETELLFQIVRDLKVARHRDRLHHPFHRPGLPDRRPHLGAAQRPPGRRGADGGTAAAEADLADARPRARAHRGARRAAASVGERAEPILVAEGLGRRRIMAPFDLSLRAGEVVGLAGLLGSGRTEVAKLIFGAMRPDSGTSRSRRRADDDPFAAPVAAPRHGVLPRGPQGRGPVRRTQRAREHRARRCRPSAAGCGASRRTSRSELAEEMIKALAIATPDADKPVGQLSGGNQQKVVLARSLVSGPRILILDEPTRGIDVGAHAEIVALIRKLCAQGLALLVASSELDELVAVSDRIAVLRDRRKIGEIAGDDITRENIIRTIAGAST